MSQTKHQCCGYNINETTKYNYNKRCNRLTNTLFCENHTNLSINDVLRCETNFVTFNLTHYKNIKITKNKINNATELFTFLSKSHNIIYKHATFCLTMNKKCIEFLKNPNVLSNPELVKLITDMKTICDKILNPNNA